MVDIAAPEYASSEDWDSRTERNQWCGVPRCSAIKEDIWRAVETTISEDGETDDAESS